MIYRADAYDSFGVPIYVSQYTVISAIAVGNAVFEEGVDGIDQGDELYASCNRNEFGQIYVCGSGAVFEP